MWDNSTSVIIKSCEFHLDLNLSFLTFLLTNPHSSYRNMKPFILLINDKSIVLDSYTSITDVLCIMQVVTEKRENILLPPLLQYVQDWHETT